MEELIGFILEVKFGDNPKEKSWKYTKQVIFRTKFSGAKALVNWNQLQIDVTCSCIWIEFGEYAFEIICWSM